MIKLTFGDLNQNMMMHTLHKLGATSFSNIKTAYHIGRILDKIEAEVKHGRKFMNELIQSVTEKDEKGFVKLREPRDPASFTILEEKKEEFEKKQADFMAIEITIPKHKLRLDDLAEAKLTPSELMSIQSFLVETEMEVVEGGKA